MASLYDFEIVTRYDLDAEPEELTAIVLDPAMVLKWRPSVIMHGKLLDEGRPDGQGIAVRLYVKGWLPYGLAFTARIAEVDPHRMVLVAVDGDFQGTGRIALRSLAPSRCRARLHWQVSIGHPWLKRLAPVLRPLFRWNHVWAMNSAHRHLQAEIYWRRRGAANPEQVWPAFPHNIAPLRDWLAHRAAARGWNPSAPASREQI